MPVVSLPHGGGLAVCESGDAARRVRELSDYRTRAAVAACRKAQGPAGCLGPLGSGGADGDDRNPAAALRFDYYGFQRDLRAALAQPETWLAARVRALLSGAGIASAEDSQRGFDHGTFIPLLLAYRRRCANDSALAQARARSGRAPGDWPALSPLRDRASLSSAAA